MSPTRSPVGTSSTSWRSRRSSCRDLRLYLPTYDDGLLATPVNSLWRCALLPAMIRSKSAIAARACGGEM